MTRRLDAEARELGVLLRRRRLELGLAQRDAAIDDLVSWSTIYEWEHGRQLVTVARVLIYAEDRLGYVLRLGPAHR
jgi:transcriptional regulator with XRE-family HTH domain